MRKWRTRLPGRCADSRPNVQAVNGDSMPELAAQSLLRTKTVAIRDVCCHGSCKQSTEEYAIVTELVFPYRGVYVRHLGHDQAIADGNHVLFFNAGEGYRVSHPVQGGDASLSLAINEPQLRELAPRAFLRDSATAAFQRQGLRIDARTQALVARLRHSLRQNIAEPLKAESLALTLVQQALGVRTMHTIGGSIEQRLLVDRAKLLLMSDLSRRWTLAAVSAEARCSPVYLTQLFQRVEGLPMYRYQLRLRLARALHLIAQYDDLTALALDVGFSSHSHFSAAFRQAYGCSPSEFRQSALRC